MELSVVEEEKNRLKVEVKGMSKSFVHTIAREVWELEKGDAAALREHPFMVEPKILVKGKNPRKILTAAADSVAERCDELKESYRRALKK